MPASVSTLSTRQRIAWASIVAAPLLAIVGSALTPNDTNNAAREVARFAAHRDRYYVGYLVLAVALWLIVPASTALVRLFRDQGSRAGAVSCTILAIGAVFFGAGTLMTGVVDRVLTGGKVNHAAAVSVVHAADHSAAAGLPWILGTLFFVGILALAGSLLYARTVPWWQPALLVAGGVCIFISGSGPSSIPLGLPILAAFASLAWSLVRMPEPAPASVDLTASVPSQHTPADTPQRADA